ncbi:disease resistance protein RPV1-like isoform X2 [Cornus florida]|nr:disease resistance protein RPV1-like isoform X2 [Cornus florida]XP_059653601.1 disease resistance protein RPV1-like isoform X2 [Cornus florida]
MGGIGKTTIAKTIYNLNFDKFEVSTFLANIRETSSEPKGLVRLQRQLLSDILKGKKVKVSSVDEGIVKIKDAICCKRVLIVLDDVDQAEQLNAVLTMRDWFHPGSKIVITTRNEQLLKAHKVYKIHKVKELTDDESIQLLSWHAFEQECPVEAFMEHSKMIVKYCGGLPLALQVLGSSLSGRSVDVWESALKKLVAIPDSEIIRKLKVSFDSLQDDHDKNLFLDIACFFVGEDKDFVITLLDGCNYFTKFGIDNLIHRYLLTINEDNKLTMHQLLRDMGRHIISQESLKEPGKRSRLWHHEDALNVLKEKTGTETIEGLILNLQLSKEDKPAKNFFGLDDTKNHHFEDFLDESTLLHGSNWWKRLGLLVTSALTEPSSASNEVDIQTDAFSRMHNLRLLQLNNVRLTGNYKQFPTRLRWLCWRGFSLKSIPNDFPLECLVVLDMQYSSLKQVWKGNKLLRSLKILNLSHSHDLTNMSNFSKVPNLERLILKDCIHLIELHESIGELEKLVLLDLKGCKNLRELPSKVDHLKCLEKLVLSGCLKLHKLPRELGKLESLTVLHADEVAISELSCSTGELKSWHAVLRSWVFKPIKCSESITFSSGSLLVSLSLANCNLFDDVIPLDLSSLSLLRYLNLSGNSIRRVPDIINCLSMLQELCLDSCTSLKSLPELPRSLVTLRAQNCMSLEKLTNLPNLLRSLFFDVTGCEKLVEVQGLFKLEAIGNFDAEMVNSLGLCNLKSIRNTEVELFNKLTETRKKGPIQGLHEFGIFSTSLPGSKFSDGFSIKNMGTSISFNVPSLSSMKIQGLNICLVYASYSKYEYGNGYSYHIKVLNKTKGLMWVYSPMVIGIPGAEEEMTWLSHWKFGNQLEAGDELSVSVVGWSCPFWMKECGISFVYDKQEEKVLQSKSKEKEQLIQQNTTYPCYQDVNDGDLSSYQFGNQRAYFLSYLEFFMLKKP